MRGPSGGIRLVATLLMVASVSACNGADPSFDSYAAIVADEDGRGALGFTAVTEGLTSEDARVRAWAVRALGRQEDTDLLGRIAPSLRDDSPSVREAAWFATAQALYGEPAADRVLSLIGEAGGEADATVLGAMATVLGWAGTPEGDGALLSRVGEALAGLAGRIRTADDPDLNGQLGLARGLEALARTRGNLVVQQAVGELATPLLTTPQGEQPARAARVRTLAVAALGAAGTISQEALIEAAGDADPEVRRAALGVIGRLGRGYREAVPAALSDPSPTVRVAALATWDRWVRPGAGCEAAFELARDPNPNVALTAVDMLRRPCGDVQAQRDLLANLINDGSSTWHRPAHALVALAGLAPEQARASLGALRDHASPFARAWAARAAAEAADIATLETLARDGNPNVRTAALTGLLATGARDRDPFVEALDLDDPQVVMTALGGLVSTQEEHAVRALEALGRFTERGMWTERDVRMALLDFLAPSPHVAEADLEGYVTDFDPRVAGRAATALQERGLTVAADPNPLEPESTPTARRLATLAASQVVLEMAAGPETPPLGRVVIALRPDLAATNADRLARLAESGELDGLTFHRVVPNFVVQGGSPGANEYAGHGEYTRDEIGAEGHWRGMVGLSTRGRDTGDAQIFVNLIDNTRLDFNYTILGEVIDGMDVVDRLAEGAVIRTARLERRRAP